MKILRRTVETKLQEAANLQGAFWEALRDLEEALDDYELDANDDLDDIDSDGLLEAARAHSRARRAAQ